MLEVGRIVKPHGIRGEVIVDMITNRAEDRLVPGFVLDSNAGPMEVVASRPHQGRWIVSFVGVTDRNTAETLRGRTLAADPLEETDDGTLWVHDLIGSEVVDIAGRSHGAVLAIEAQRDSDLLVLANDRLIPLVFVVEATPGRILVDVPAGLLDD